MAPVKRIKTTLTLQQKADILHKLNKNITGKRISVEYKISKSTVTYIKKHKKEILDNIRNADSKVHKKTLHKSEFPEMENQLYKWFVDQRSKNCTINGPILKAKAKEIFGRLYPNNETGFSASDGWFSNFKRRKGIRIIKVCGEKLSGNADAINPFLVEFQTKVGPDL